MDITICIAQGTFGLGLTDVINKERVGLLIIFLTSKSTETIIA